MDSRLSTVADRHTLLAAIQAGDPELNAGLRASARRVCDDVFGREVFMRGLVEVSNVCVRNCHYCGLRGANRTLSRYRMSIDETVERAHLVKRCGLPTLVMQSGEGAYSCDEICSMVRRIKDETGLVVTLSFGEFSPSDYQRLRDAGADRYLLRHETSDPELYARLHPGFHLSDRLACLDSIRDSGFEVGSGFMVGLPGQTSESILQDLELLAERQVHMAGVGPFISSPDTPLNGCAGGTVDVVLNVIAILRHALPGCNQPATTALDSLADDGREQGLDAGANVVMPVLTPEGNKERYTLYPNKRCLTHNPVGCVGCSRARLMAQGYLPSTDAGWSRSAEHAARALDLSAAAV